MTIEEVDLTFPSVEPQEARAKGYIPLTTAFVLPRQREMLESVIADHKRNGSDYSLVRRRNRRQGGYEYRQLEVWRPKHRHARPVTQEAPSIFAFFWPWGNELAAN